MQACPYVMTGASGNPAFSIIEGQISPV